MTAYRDAIIGQAIADYATKTKGPDRRFVNLFEGTNRKGSNYSDATMHFDIDDAAEDAVEYQAYVGTVMIHDDGTAVMLDLRAHGEAMAEEGRRNASEEADHENELRGRWNE